MGFCWCTVSVADLEKSIAFYTEVVGLPVQNRFKGGADVEICFLGEGETKVELIHDAKHRPPGRVEGVTLGFEVASLDERINAGMAEYEAALKANKKPYQLHMYEGANHAFNNDTNAARYDKAAATQAWGRTVSFLRKCLT